MSHLAGACIFAWLSIYLLRPVLGSWGRFLAVGVFVAAAVFLLLVSSMFHMFAPGSMARAVMLRIDLVAIFTLIAGTFTPIHVLLFRGWRRWGVLVMVWSIAILGSAARVIYFESFSETSGALLFLAMGWIGGFTAWCLWRGGHRRWIVACVAGGVFYSLGAVSNVLNGPTPIPGIWGPHETLHLAVLAGLSCHWWVIAGAVEYSHENAARFPEAGGTDRSSRKSPDMQMSNHARRRVA
jgi:channel protein (hemolysin III family)